MQINSICALVVTYNSGNDYLKNFISIKDQIDKTIIIDNGSDETTLSMLKTLEDTYPDNVIIIRNNANFGLAKAQNIGIKQAIKLGYEWVLLLDDDSCAEENMVSHMMHFYDQSLQQDQIAILAPFIINTKYHKKSHYASIDTNFFKIRKTFADQKYMQVYFAIASGSLLKTSAYIKTGEFKDDFFIDYIDVEYGLRLILNGFKTIVVEKAKLYHRLGDRQEIKIGEFSIITSNHNYFRKYHIFRNRIKVWRLYFKSLPKFIMYDILTSVCFFFKTIILEKNRFKKGLYIVKGIIAGFKEKL